MDTEADERELIRKLVFTGHLNVPERRAIPDRKAKASLIYSVIEEGLQSGGWFHAWWLPDDSMIGCDIKYRGDRPSRICWTYSGIEGERSCIREYDSLRRAAESFAEEARQFWGNAIDGVPIDWDA
ncbi:MAG TPA: hypothetical protein VG097_04995 [Gemmata sp.]|jgi:hypothetical protein|nr:hypothetical protein [Gemmata sp.]